jgi:hypothetical protein
MSVKVFDTKEVQDLLKAATNQVVHRLRTSAAA